MIKGELVATVYVRRSPIIQQLFHLMEVCACIICQKIIITHDKKNVFVLIDVKRINICLLGMLHDKRGNRVKINSY